MTAGGAPGDSNMKATTSPPSSAFIVIASSLPAHLSILPMLFRFMPAGGAVGREGGEGVAASWPVQGTAAALAAGRAARMRRPPACSPPCARRRRCSGPAARRPNTTTSPAAHPPSTPPPTHGEGAVAAKVLKAVGAQRERDEADVAAVHGLQRQPAAGHLEVGLRDQILGGLQHLAGGRRVERQVQVWAGACWERVRAGVVAVAAAAASGGGGERRRDGAWLRSPSGSLGHAGERAGARHALAPARAARTFFSRAPCSRRASNMAAAAV